MATGVVDSELERLMARVPGLDDSSRSEVAHTLRRVADKLLHQPTVRVRELTDPEGSLTYADALADLFALDPAAVAAVAGAPVGAPRILRPVVAVTDLAVRWPRQSDFAVAGVTFQLHPGDRMLIAGPSGSGKTRIAQALVRLLDYAGSYRIDGVEARDLPQQAVRRVVGLCEQRPWLFDESIRQNLLFARDTATDEELLAVLARVGLAEWTVERGGLDARVGQRGALVSGGQAQRIAVARALLADFPVLILDEPTANVDVQQADRLVRDILQAAGAERAVLLISHTPVPAELITKRLDLAVR